MQTAVRITVDNIEIMTVDGRFDAHTAAAVENWLTVTTNNAAPQLVLNLEKATFIDTFAISVLVQGLKHSRQKGGNFVLCNLPQPVRIIFELMRIDRAFDIFETESDAISSFEQTKPDSVFKAVLERET